jgi:serine/threonine-protein kinase HipA
MATTRILTVWMNRLRVGTWTQVRGGDAFSYAPAWLESPAARVVSLSLPFTPGNVPHKGEVVAAYFENLLPDSATIRARLQSKFATASTEAFDLLTAIGRDCVGAVQLLPEDQFPDRSDRIDAEPLSEAGVERAIATALSGGRVVGQPNEDDFRISIAGAQEKTALLWHQGKWCRPRGATPTTHILKLPLGLVGNLQADMRDSVENEWLCSRLMQAFGLETAHCEMARFGRQKVLVVQRFDRALQEGRWIARLPQEDLCQALGVPAARKYESEGGPGMRDILRVLDASVRPAEDKRAFVKAQIVYWLLAATDGHAKNYSVFHERGGTHRLTPFYDVLSAWPIIGRGPNLLDERKAQLALAVRSKNAHWKLSEIRARHWDAVARSAGLGDATALLAETASQTAQVIEKVGRQIPRGFPAKVQDRIFAGLRESTRRLEESLPD